MRKPTPTCLPAAQMFVAVLALADVSVAADAVRKLDQTLSASANIANLAELEDVLVEGRTPETDTRKLRSWMERLVGEFRYEGHVERLSGNSADMNRADVRGHSICVRFGNAAAVQCQLNVTWPEIRGPDGAPVPGGVSALTPAIAVYSLEVRAKYVGYLNVDNEGVATGAKGWLLGDTLIARSPCADFAGKCERVLRLEALPDARVIRMRVDLERDGKVEVRYNFQWIRIAPGLPAAVAAVGVLAPVAAPPVESRVYTAVPPYVDSWLRRMIGKYRVTRHRACRYVRGPDKAAGCTEMAADAAVARETGPLEAECQGIGAGPGLRCVVHMEWPESGIPPKRWAKNHTPLFMLYGFDPVQRDITQLRVLPTVDTVGASQLIGGQLRDGELTQCFDQACNIRSHERIAPNGEWIRFASVTLRLGDPSVQEAGAWRMYRVIEGSSGEAGSPRRAPTNRSPRR
jgi:hypothetical protein